MANMKQAFYAIAAHLARVEHFPEVALGSACEAWLNTEACIAINSWNPRVLAEGEHAFTETKKRDIVVRGADVRQVTHHIEVKLLYPWTDARLREEKFLDLRRQLEGRATAADEDERTRRSGILIAIWRSEYLPEEPSQFFRRASALLRENFPAGQYTTQHDYVFERISDRRRVQRPGGLFEMQAAAAYVTQRPGE